MFELTLQLVVLRLAALLLLAAVQGFAVAGVAGVLGDAGPRQDGRVGVGPLRHLDLVGGPLAVVFGCGWLRPIDVAPGWRRAGLLLVVATAAPLALAVALQVMRPWVLPWLGDYPAETLSAFVTVAAPFYGAMAVFNLLPLPSLSGEVLLLAVWPGGQRWIRRARPYAAAVLGVLIASGGAARLLGRADAALLGLILPV